MNFKCLLLNLLHNEEIKSIKLSFGADHIEKELIKGNTIMKIPELKRI